jgi:hypothetical protein
MLDKSYRRLSGLSIREFYGQSGGKSGWGALTSGGEMGYNGRSVSGKDEREGKAESEERRVKRT